MAELKAPYTSSDLSKQFRDYAELTLHEKIIATQESTAPVPHLSENVEDAIKTLDAAIRQNAWAKLPGREQVSAAGNKFKDVLPTKEPVAASTNKWFNLFKPKTTEASVKPQAEQTEQKRYKGPGS